MSPLERASPLIPQFSPKANITKSDSLADLMAAGKPDLSLPEIEQPSIKVISVCGNLFLSASSKVTATSVSAATVQLPSIARWKLANGPMTATF